MKDFNTILAGTPNMKGSRPTRTAFGKRDFDAYVEREVGEAFYEQAGRLTAAFMVSIDSAIHDPNDQEGAVADRIRRNVDQFVAALAVAVDSMDGAAETTEKAIRKGGTSRMNKRSDVVAEVERLAVEHHPDLASRSIGAARSKIWKEHPGLAKRHDELPVEVSQAPPVEKPVLKGADALAKIDAEAASLRKADPRLSEREARVQAVRRNPELRDEYHRAFTGR